MQLSFDSFRETRNEGLNLPSGMNFKIYVSSRLQLRHKWLSLNKASFHFTYIDGFQFLRVSRWCPRNSDFISKLLRQKYAER